MKYQISPNIQQYLERVPQSKVTNNPIDFVKEKDAVFITTAVHKLFSKTMGINDNRSASLCIIHLNQLMYCMFVSQS